MSEYKCPSCGKELTDGEVKDMICLDCGCVFSVNPDNKKTKKYSGIIKDTRKMNYRFWIKFHIFFLILWAILTVYGIVQGFISAPAPWNFIILIVAVILYAIVFTLVQFQINMIRDVYVLKKKIESLQENKNKE